MTDHTYENFGITVHVPRAVEYPNGEARKVKIKTGGTTVLMFRLTAENITALRGAERGGIKTSARVWDVLVTALDRYTTGADQLLPDDRRFD